VYHDDAAVDPMRMLLGLLRRAQTSGAAVVEHCPVKSLTRLREGFEIATPRGVVRAAKVLLATNGHSGPLSSWHRRRVIPIGSYQIATEPLGCDRVRELIPHARNIVDTRRVVVYYRPSADGERIIFGGRAALAETNAHACVPRLRAMLTQVFRNCGRWRLPMLGRDGCLHLRYAASPRSEGRALSLHGVLRPGCAARALFRVPRRTANGGLAEAGLLWMTCRFRRGPTTKECRGSWRRRCSRNRTLDRLGW